MKSVDPDLRAWSGEKCRGVESAEGLRVRYLAKCMQLYLLPLFVVPLEAPGWEFSVSLPQRILARGRLLLILCCCKKGNKI